MDQHMWITVRMHRAIQPYPVGYEICDLCRVLWQDTILSDMSQC